MTKAELESHDCGWREIAFERAGKIALLEAQVSKLQRSAFGKSSEKPHGKTV